MRPLAWRYALVYCCIGLLAMALLIALGLTPSALTAGGTSVMGRGGQLEKPLLW